MQRLKDILQTLLTIAILGGITTILYLYTAGYRLQKNENQVIDVTKTGMINAKSIPESAGVYLDGKLVSATNDTVAGVTPGKHTLKISKKGFFDWNKDIEVFQELVTDITAVLVSQSPRIEPLTNTGARLPIGSPSISKIAYFSEGESEPGIYLINLSGFNVNLFKGPTNYAIKDTKTTKYSQGKSIKWSPDESQILIQGASDIYYLIDLQNNTAETTATPAKVQETWKADVLATKTETMGKVEITDDIKKLALSEEAVWSPDNKKFLINLLVGNKMQYKVFNFEKPLPVGEKTENIVFETNAADSQPKITWYSDSFHLIMVEGNPEKDKKGVISIIRIDGTNKTEIYSNTLLSDIIFATPDGEKVLILTSFKSSGQTDLYTVSIR